MKETKISFDILHNLYTMYTLQSTMIVDIDIKKAQPLCLINNNKKCHMIFCNYKYTYHLDLNWKRVITMKSMREKSMIR